jgi:hypothetical protein
MTPIDTRSPGSTRSGPFSGPRRRGNALIAVAVFISIVAGLVMVLSGQSSGVRRANARSHHGSECVEFCASAINEAAAQVDMGDVFPGAGAGGSGPFGNMQAFLLKVSSEDEAGLKANYPGYGFDFRNLTSSGTTGRIFVSMTWPDNVTPTKANGYSKYLKQYNAPHTESTVAGQLNSKGAPLYKISPINMSVLAWRRDFAGVQWQDWGVLHFVVTTTYDDGNAPPVIRTMHVDRMFTIFAHTIATGPDCPPDAAEAAAAAANDVFSIFLHYIQSQRNLKTVILRS